MDVTFLSHTGKPWSQHIEEVEAIAKEKSKLYTSDTNIQRKVEIIIRSHDFGKLTEFFLRKLEDPNNPVLWTLESRHSLYSAVFAAFWTFREPLLREEDALFIFNIVAHHHSDLSFLNRLLPAGTGEETIEGLKTQLSLHDVYPSETEALFIQFQNQQKNLDSVLRAFQEVAPDDTHVVSSFLSSELSIIQTLFRLSKQSKKFSLFSRKQNGEECIVYRYLYSLLVNSDILSASHTTERPLGRFTSKQVQDKRNEMLSNLSLDTCDNGESYMNQLRESSFYSVMETIQKVVKGPGIYTITSPCGSGKTITGFSAAVEIRDRLMEGDLKDRKIIYALPFTTLVTQNTEVVERLLSLDEGVPDDEKMSFLLQHHYLTPFIKETEDDIRTEKILLENWNSSVIVTTFVQLFETLVGHRKRSLKKLQSLQGAVVILDEIQSVPFRYWRFISYLFELYTRELGITFIIMTATKPEIAKQNAIELFPSHEDVFRSLNRTKIVPILDIRYNVEDLIQRQVMSSFERTKQSHLVVFNTIHSSLRAFHELQKHYRPEQLYYLSTNITPNSRKEVVNEVSRLLTERTEPIILISTQVIEAGVNVDFDIVFREIAPLDSIIQTAGRGNRNYNNAQSLVYVFILDTQGEAIYNDILIRLTRAALSESAEIEEKDYLDLIERYFSSVSAQTHDEYDRFKQYMQKIQHNERNKGLCEFQLIDDRPHTATVLVQQTNEVRDLYHKYKTSVTSILRQVKWKRLQEFIIHVPNRYCEPLMLDEETGFYIVPFERISLFYDKKSGFIR